MDYCFENEIILKIRGRGDVKFLSMFMVSSCVKIVKIILFFCCFGVVLNFLTRQAIVKLCQVMSRFVFMLEFPRISQIFLEFLRISVFSIGKP
jgi:hypothetical protein